MPTKYTRSNALPLALINRSANASAGSLLKNAVWA
jgi:hypothetical protein